MESWAIVVGINEYPARSEQKPLSGAVADACDFADWVLDPAGGGVPDENLYFWTYPWPAAPTGRLQSHLNRQQGLGGPPLANPPHWHLVLNSRGYPDQSRPPTAGEIVTTIEEVGRAARLNRTRRDGDAKRRVFVFFAGHGIRASTFGGDQETCFLAGDFQLTSSSLISGLVPCESLRKSLLAERFNEVIFFTDCCRGTLPRTNLTAQPVADLRLPTGAPPYSIAYAAQDNQLAYETIHPVEQVSRGAFSSVLMRGLRTLRVGAPDTLHAAPLKDYVQQGIKDFTNSGQMPSMMFVPDDRRGPLIVEGLPTGPPPPGPVLDVSALPAGTQLVLYGGDDLPVAGIVPLIVNDPTVQLPWLLPGLYRVEVGGQVDRSTLFRVPSAGVVHVT